MNEWLSFAILVSVQLVVYIAFYFYTKTRQRKNFLKVLGVSCMVGVPFGVLFDLAIADYAGIYVYELGFGLSLLAINGLLSFGFMIATTRCWTRVSFFTFYFYSVILGFIYEVTNYYFPVWEWTFSSVAWHEYIIVVGVAYVGLSLLMAAALRITGITSFAFFKDST